MIRGRQTSGSMGDGPGPAPAAQLPYAVELWNLPRTAAERIVGRAASIVLARAIFAAACTEHLGRRLILRRGTQVLMDTDHH